MLGSGVCVYERERKRGKIIGAFASRLYCAYNNGEREGEREVFTLIPCMPSSTIQYNTVLHEEDVNNENVSTVHNTSRKVYLLPPNHSTKQIPCSYIWASGSFPGVVWMNQ